MSYMEMFGKSMFPSGDDLFPGFLQSHDVLPGLPASNQVLRVVLHYGVKSLQALLLQKERVEFPSCLPPLLAVQEEQTWS